MSLPPVFFLKNLRRASTNHKKFLHLKLRKSDFWMRKGHWLKSATSIRTFDREEHKPLCWTPQVTQSCTGLHFVVVWLNLKHLVHWLEWSMNCRIFWIECHIFISWGREEPRDVTETGETSRIESFRMNQWSSKILISFEAVISRPNSASGICTEMLNKRNLFIMFSHTILFAIGTLRNSEMLLTSIAHSIT